MNIKYKFSNMIMVLLVLLFWSNMQAQTNDTLSEVVLGGDKGELAVGGEWSSSLLKNKVSLILYVDPDKQGDVKSLVSKLDSINYSPDLLNITFILNTDATLIPDFIIRNRIKKRAESVPNISYVLDFKKVLVKEWGLSDDDVNVILMDNYGVIVEKHHGKMSEQYMKNFIDKINYLIKKGETK